MTFIENITKESMLVNIQELPKNMSHLSKKELNGLQQCILDNPNEINRKGNGVLSEAASIVFMQSIALLNS